jgi:hypothetical protein
MKVKLLKDDLAKTEAVCEAAQNALLDQVGATTTTTADAAICRMPLRNKPNRSGASAPCKDTDRQT